VIFFCLLIAFSANVTSRPQDTLAPHPLYFTVDGRPTVLNVDVDKQHFKVGWDGRYLSIYQTSKGHDGADLEAAWIERPPPEQPEEPINPNTFLSGCGCYLLVFGPWILGGIWFLIWLLWK
jgi:hypothetical protein